MSRGPQRGTGPAFLLAQLGAHAAARFAERLAEHDLTPPHAGILWNLASQPDLTQRELADVLGAFPSRLVLQLDDLEKRGLLELCAALSDDERTQLRELLGKIATQQQLRPGVHPGYRKH
jgi:DNA-binding MarR family transcriptional regulator